MSEQLLNEQALMQIYEDYLNMNMMSDGINQRINEIIKCDYEKISSNTYLKIMYMKGIRYENDDNKNAARFCSLRMMQVIDTIHNPKIKRSSYMEYEEEILSDDMEGFMYRYNEFLDEVNRKMHSRLSGYCLIVFALFLILLIIAGLGFLFALTNAIMLTMINYFIQKSRMPKLFMNKQLKAIEKYVEADLLDFDRYIRYM